jgi:hypothetical protein
MFRVISEARPAWVLGENVPGIIPMELDNVLSDLEGIGYTTRAFVIPACAVDARHRRDRVWIIRRNMANAQSERSGCVDGHEKYSEQDQFNGLSQQSRGKGCDVSNHEGERSQGVGKTWREGTDQYGSEVLSVRDGGDRAEWLPEPGMGRVVDGLPQKLDGGINDKVDGEKTISTKYFPEWEMLRAMWHDRELAKASPELRVRKMLYFLSAMSCDYGSASWNTEAEKDPGVFSLWKEISTSGFSQSPNLFLRLFEQIGANKCAQEVAQWITEPAIPRVAIGVKDRVKRLKGLGNAIVSQVAYEILREIRKLI